MTVYEFTNSIHHPTRTLHRTVILLLSVGCPTTTHCDTIIAPPFIIIIFPVRRRTCGAYKYYEFHETMVRPNRTQAPNRTQGYVCVCVFVTNWIFRDAYPAKSSPPNLVHCRKMLVEARRIHTPRVSPQTLICPSPLLESE